MSEKDEKAERLATALRENLRRRKAHLRDRPRSQPEPDADGGQ